MSFEKSGIVRNHFTDLLDYNGNNFLLVCFHKINGTSNLFTAENCTNKELSSDGLFSKLKDVVNYKVDNKYTFLVIQDGFRFAWSQTDLPTRALPSGFSVIENSQNGSSIILSDTNKGLCLDSSYGYARMWRTDATGNWHGAIGCKTSWNKAFPGVGSSLSSEYTKDGGCCPLDYQATYIRVPDNFSINKDRLIVNDFIEE